MALLFDPFFQAIDENGNPLSGAKLYFYITGTSTPKDTFPTSALTNPANANPVVADAAGRFGAIYLAQDVDYKVILKTSADVTIATRDPLLVLTTSAITTQGDLIIGNSLGAAIRLAIGAENYTLRSNGTTAAWRAPAYTKQVFTSGSGTWTRPTNCTAIHVRFCAGGGGGGGTGGTLGPTGSTGGTSSFNSVTAIGGTGGAGNATGTALTGVGGAGGTGGAGSADVRRAGGDGASGGNGAGTFRGGGGGSWIGPGAPNTQAGSGAATGIAAKANSGGGGGGSSSEGTTESAKGGGGGEYCELFISAPSASYSYAVGAGGAGGVGTGTAAATGGAGGSGIVIVTEYYS